ncbi:MAG TPA: hypothetical protein VGR06_25710 [Actinophytocola sp.]|uniref:hypothetical protein n=1 Tax=Actinophytocola sp. TaxID=1872138 RepID=UPI002E055116|nr:hypothetical protein [Actinophytocola sp.]
MFNSNGTFGGQFTGQWRQQAGTIMLSFDSGPAKYGGNVNSNIGVGAMSTFSGLDGSWYLSKDGTTGIALETVVEAAAQPAGADGTALALAGAKAGGPDLSGNGAK